jgi:hypothetical protein
MELWYVRSVVAIILALLGGLTYLVFRLKPGIIRRFDRPAFLGADGKNHK